MSATVQLNDRQAIALDAIKGRATTTKGVLLTLEGTTPGEAMNCAVIPLGRVRAVIASLELVAKEAERA